MSNLGQACDYPNSFGCHYDGTDRTPDQHSLVYLDPLPAASNRPPDGVETAFQEGNKRVKYKSSQTDALRAATPSRPPDEPQGGLASGRPPDEPQGGLASGSDGTAPTNAAMRIFLTGLGKCSWVINCLSSSTPGMWTL